MDRTDETCIVIVGFATEKVLMRFTKERPDWLKPIVYYTGKPIGN